MLSSLVQPKAAERAHAQVLAIPLPGAESHLFVMSVIVNELAQRGHSVMVRPRPLYPCLGVKGFCLRHACLLFDARARVSHCARPLKQPWVVAQLAIPESDLPALARVNSTRLRVLTYDSAYSKQARAAAVRADARACAGHTLCSTAQPRARVACGRCTSCVQLRAGLPTHETV